jgi:flagellar motor switch protein FliM
VILVGYEVHIGETVGTMNFCIPLMVLNPILDQISQQAHFSRRMSPEMAEITFRAIDQVVRRAIVPVDVVLGRAKLTLSDVARLRVGDVIPLNGSPHEPMVAEVGGQPQFKVRPGRRREHVAVQVVGFTPK